MQKIEQNHEKNEKVEKIENNDEIYNKYLDKAEILEKLKKGGKIHADDLERIRTKKIIKSKFEKVCSIFDDVIMPKHIRWFFYELPTKQFSEENKKILIELLGKEQYRCISNGNFEKINELFPNKNSFEIGNDFAKKNTLLRLVSKLSFEYKLDADGIRKQVDFDDIKKKRNLVISFIESNNIDHLLKIIYIIFLKRINKIEFYFAYTYCFHGLLDNTYNIGESQFTREYYLNRYYGHTLFMKPPSKKNPDKPRKESTCISRDLLKKNGMNHTYQVLNIITGYFNNKYEIKELIRLSEEHYFNTYRKNGCVLVNVKDSGEAVKKKKNKKKEDRRDCEFCGKPNVNYSIKMTDPKSHFNSKGCLKKRILRKEIELEELRREQEEQEEEPTEDLDNY